MPSLKPLKKLLRDGLRDVRRLAQLRKLKELRRTYEEAVQRAKQESGKSR